MVSVGRLYITTYYFNPHPLKFEAFAGLFTIHYECVNRVNTSTTVCLSILFQGVRDHLYKTPVKISEYSYNLNSYLGAIGFTRPVEMLSLKEVLYSSLMAWLAKPTGPQLVAPDAEDDPYTTLAISWTPESLYHFQPAKVGIGLVYKAPYIQAASFTEACFSLRSAWAAAPGHWPLNPSLMFVQIAETSQMIPQPAERPLFLDVKGPKFITDFSGPRSPLVFRGFRLHKTFLTMPDSKRTQVVIPRLQGEAAPHVVDYWKPQTIPEYRRDDTLDVSLAAVVLNHLNQLGDRVYPACLTGFQKIHEDSQRASTQADQPVIGSIFISTADASNSTASSSTQTPALPKVGDGTSPVEQLLHDILAVKVETMQDMGFIRETDRALARAFAAEFFRLHLIIGEDLNASLRGLMVDLQRTTSDLIRDLDTACSQTTGPPSTNPTVEWAMECFHRTVQMRMAVPLLQLDSAREDVGKFMRSRLSEPYARKELTSLLTCLVDKLNTHEQRLRELIMGQSLSDPEVALQIIVGLGAYQPIDTKLFPGVMEGLLGSLGIDATGKGNPPVSSREGVTRRWATAVQEALWQIEGKNTSHEINPSMPSGLHLGYEEDFRLRFPADVPRVFTDLEFLMKIARSVYDWGAPSSEESPRFGYTEGSGEAPGATASNSSNSALPPEVPSGTGTPGTSQPPSPAKVLDESDTDSTGSTGTEDLA